MLAMDNLSIGDRVGLNTSDEDAEEPSHLRFWQQSVQLPTHRDGEPKKELLKYMRVKDHDFAVQDNGEQAANAAKADKKEIKLVDVLQDLQTKEEIKERCKCLSKTKILESSDEDSEEIDEL